MSEADANHARASLSAFEATLARLREEYTAGLPQRVAQAREHLLACQAAPDDTLAMEALHRCMHTMAGTAGTLGLAQVGSRARAIEEALLRMQKAPGCAGGLEAIALQVEQLCVPHG